MTSTEPSEGTSTSSDFDRMAATESAVNILAQGKRNMVCGEIPTAVNQFQEACKLLAKAYGETAKECADAYFCYGQALLDLARMENGVLGNALQGVPDTDEDESSDQKSDQFEKVEMEADEREKLRQDVYDAMSEKEKTDAEKKQAGETVEVAMDTDDSSTKPAEKGDDEKGDVKDTEKEKGDKEKLEKKEGNEDEQEVKKASSEEKKIEDKEVDKKTEENEKDVGKSEDKDAKSDNKEAEVDNEEAKVDDKSEADKIVEDKAKAEDKAKDEAKAEDEEAKADLKKEDEKGEEKKGEGEKDGGEKDGEEKDGEEKEGEEKEGEEKDGEESMEDEEEGGGTEEEEGEDTADDVSQDESQDGENPDDVSNLQLAWEMLELAKLIYSKDESKEAQLRTAESHLKLGEVSMETEQYEEAIRDFTSCLTIQKEILEADNRLLAETYYQLGLANCFAKKFTESVESYQAAIKCIESRIKKLEEVLEKATPEEKESKDFDSPVYKANKEVNDLRELLPDIKSKIDDCEDERKNMDELKNLAKEALGGLAASVAPAKSDGETSQEEVKTTDISHLIKRKRKSEDSEGDATKKARQEDGTGDAPPVTNGHSEKDESKETVESKS